MAKTTQLTHFNAVKHGILSRQSGLPHEDKGQYEALRQSLLEELKPQGVCVTELVQDIVDIL